MKDQVQNLIDGIITQLDSSDNNVKRVAFLLDLIVIANNNDLLLSLLKHIEPWLYRWGLFDGEFSLN